ncbi:MAG: ABC transporter ATP-binding protein [Lachnospiraceae bacterium]
MNAFRWFLSYLKKYRWLIITGLILVVLTSILILIKPYVSGVIVDEVIKKGNYEQLLPLLVILVGATILRAGLRFTFLMEFETASQGVIYSLREAVYKKLMDEDLSFYNRNRTGDLMSRQTGDMDAVRHFVSHVMYFTCENILIFLMALFMIFTVNIKLAVCMLIVLPFTAFITIKQARRIKPCFEHIRQCFSNLNAFAQENISGNRVVKAFAKEDFETEKFNRENDAYRDSQINATYVWMKYIPLFEIMSNLLTVILMIGGGYMVIQQEITIGQMVTVNGYLWMLNSPLRQAGWIINDIQRFFTSIEKIYDTYQIEPEIQTPEKSIIKERLKGGVEFQHVNYFAFDDVILKDINFKVEPGQTVGIIGATGSGKSTLINLICRFYDVTSGKVLVDGINVKKLDLTSLRGNIGMAMQDVFLFSDTIEGNIAYGNPNCSFENVKNAAITANADSFISQMPEGYDTIVGERGVGLSGGQKQRISLARALLKNPSIVILDDTTSAIDMETEALIQESLEKVAKKSTVFIIAHRISSIMKADQIFVLDNGRIVEQGNHESLLAQKGYYYTVFNHQYGEFDYFEEMRRSNGMGGERWQEISTT